MSSPCPILIYMRPIGTAQELERRRRRAVELLNQGHGICQVARIVAASPSSVVRWRDAYKKGGPNALNSKPPPHRPCRLSPKQLQKLYFLLLKGPIAHGYKTQLWTLQRVADLITKHFGVTYHISQVWRILRALRLSCQKPKRRARQQDEQATANWRKKDWPRIKKSP